MKPCILIPVHNEARTIGRLVRKVRKKQYDCVVVDDGSVDGSGDLAKENGALVIKNVVRSGKGASLMRGFEYILEKDYDGVIIMDGDGQHDPEDLEQFVHTAPKYRANIIVGNRMRDPKGMPFVRYLTNRFMSALISLPCRQNIPDTQCGYRYINTSILREIRLCCLGFEIESEMLLKACKKGYKVYSVPIETIYSDEKSKINAIKDTWKFLCYYVKELFTP